MKNIAKQWKSGVFLDSGDLSRVRQFVRMGIIEGVTTNPTILLKDRVKDIKKRTIEIAKIIYPRPLSVEVTTNDRDSMIEQAIEFSGWMDNICVKVTVHGPDGELDNLEVVHSLENEHGVCVNVTAMMSAQQCFLAAMAGATFVSLFGGRVNNMGYNCIEEIRKTRSLIDEFKLKSRLIVGSTREVLNIVEWLLAGAHIVTVAPRLLEGMIVHPYTRETVRQFLSDARENAADVPIKEFGMRPKAASKQLFNHSETVTK